MRVVFLNYSYTPGFTTPDAWIQRIRPYLLQLEALGRDHFVAYVGQIDFTGVFRQNGVSYNFSKPGRLLFPRHLHRIVKDLQPDVVIVAGLIFPLQVIQLRRHVGKKVKILVRHHADSPSGWKRMLLQRIANRYIDAYLFTSAGNAKAFIDAGIVPSQKLHEIPEAATAFIQQDKQAARRLTGINASPAFLWVGRLNANKDPLTVLTAFEQYAATRPGAKLYMIYQEEDMLPHVRQRIAESQVLTNAIVLVGKIPHEALEAWFNAADYFILASHSEGGNYALNEAMACGCIPVVSDIPASMKAIDEGRAGYCFAPGDAPGLLRVLCSLEKDDRGSLSEKVKAHSEKYLSATAIAARLQQIVQSLQVK